jgi:hypothetical protein
VRAYADISKIKRYGRQLGSVGLRRALIETKRILEAGSDEVVNKAKEILSNKQNKGVQQAIGKGKRVKRSGLAVQGIVRDKAKPDAGGMVVQIGWTRTYGKYLEFGPEHSRTWNIRPKRAPVLRFWTSGGNGVGSVVYAMKVKHEWKKSHLRTHLRPAIEKMAPRIHASLSRATGAAFSYDFTR